MSSPIFVYCKVSHRNKTLYRRLRILRYREQRRIDKLCYGDKLSRTRLVGEG
jgi:hypothetical protein